MLVLVVAMAEIEIYVTDFIFLPAKCPRRLDVMTPTNQTQHFIKLRPQGPYAVVQLVDIWIQFLSQTEKHTRSV